MSAEGALLRNSRDSIAKSGIATVPLQRLNVLAEPGLEGRRIEPHRETAFPHHSDVAAITVIEVDIVTMDGEGLPHTCRFRRAR